MRRFLLSAALLLFPSFLLALPSDVISPYHWTTTLLGSMAGKGLINMPSRLFLGDDTFSRWEMAKFVKELVDKATKEPWDFSDEDLFALNLLLEEFKWELADLGVDINQIRENLDLSYYQGVFVGGRFQGVWGYDSEKDEDNARMLYRLITLMPLRDGFVNVTVNSERRWQSEKPSDFPKLDSAVAKLHFLSLDWEGGRGYYRLGPGYLNSICLGDNPPSYAYLEVSKDIKAGKLGWFKLRQFHTTYSQGGVRRYLIARRYEKSFGKWDLGIYEMHLSDTKPPFAVFIPFFPFYATQHFWEKDYNVNVAVGLEVARNFSQGAIYTDWFIDDITTFPRHVPRKTGLVGGIRRDWEKASLHLEYIFTDRETYIHKNPNVSWLYKGYWIGTPLGPDAKGTLLRIEGHKGLPIILQLLYAQEQRSTAPIRTTSTQILLPYDIGNDKSIELATSIYRRKHSDGRKEEGTNWELRLEYTF